MSDNTETYTVTIEFTHVRGLSDLLLRLIRTMAWADGQGAKFHVWPKRRQPIVLRHNGLQVFGSLKVVKDA